MVGPNAGRHWELSHIVRARSGHAEAVLQVFDGVPDCQKDHRDRESESSDPLACVQAVQRGVTQLDVQHDQVGTRLLRLVDGLLAARRLDAVEAIRVGLVNERICGLSSTSSIVGLGSCCIFSSRFFVEER